MSATSFTVSRNPAYISGQYGTSPDLITFTTEGYVIQITSNAGTAVPLVWSDWGRPPFYQFGGGRGANIPRNSMGTWIIGDAITAWTAYNDFPQYLNNTNIQWIQQKYPATFNYWITQNIIKGIAVANAPVNPPSPIVGNTPFLPSASSAGVPTAVAPTGQTNAQAFQQLLNNSGNAAIDKQNKFNSMNYNPVSTQGTGAKWGTIAALGFVGYLLFPKSFKKVLKH